MTDNNVFDHIKRALELIPMSASAAAVMRHAEREGFAKGHHGNDILLTPQGERDAFVAGELMTGRICRYYIVRWSVACKRPSNCGRAVV